VGICTRTDLLKVRRTQYALEHPQDGFAARRLRPRRLRTRSG
jgi:hypothetical protein